MDAQLKEFAEEFAAALEEMDESFNDLGACFSVMVLNMAQNDSISEEGFQMAKKVNNRALEAYQHFHDVIKRISLNTEGGITPENNNIH